MMKLNGAIGSGRRLLFSDSWNKVQRPANLKNLPTQVSKFRN
jgi:hypothetical protein